MRPLLWLVLIVGAPFYLWSLASTGKLDGGTALVVIGLLVLSIAAFVNKYRKDALAGQVKQGQQDFWLAQRRGQPAPTVTQAPASSPYQCPHCSRPISATDAFCPSCGGRLTMAQ